MTTTPNKYQRKQIRLTDFDYSSSNLYFITICVNEFHCVFGSIKNGIIGLSEIGNIAALYLQQIEEIRNNAIIDEFIIMPNHVHCIMELHNKITARENRNRFSYPISNSVSIIINRYKGAVKRWCNENGYKDFKWQGRFHDHVIRTNEAYGKIKDYIINNPGKWYQDKFHR